ncbi:MAG: M20/M25/M40 family metallo-hydrolase [Lachnospiraceae bacterium]|nr:M20/M25/M40 family metallo-hydrolase [Lachnospiraceae bacterium]
MERKFVAYAKEKMQELIDLTCQITLIPAPSYHETERATFCKEWLENCGAKGIYIDESGNLIYPCFSGKSGKWIVLSAHMDTVFDLDVPLEIRKDGDKLYCPGIGDDSANLAVLLLGTRWIMEHPPVDSEYGLMVVGTVAEEVGSVGVPPMIDRIGAENIHRFYSFDATYNRLYPDQVNIKSYTITVKTPGGHALGNFGMPNAIEELAKVLCMISQKNLDYIKGNNLKRTTYNAGTIQGGEKRNIIAKEATLLLELRSDREEWCRVLEQNMWDALAYYRRENVSLTAETVGNQPRWSTVSDEVIEAMTKEHLEIMHSLGLDPLVSKSGTDCRYPMHRGIPSVCLGLCMAGNPHSVEEYLIPDSLSSGLELLLVLMEHLFF